MSFPNLFRNPNVALGFGMEIGNTPLSNTVENMFYLVQGTTGYTGYTGSTGYTGVTGPTGPALTGTITGQYLVWDSVANAWTIGSHYGSSMDNTNLGTYALNSRTGTSNTAIGYYALSSIGSSSTGNTAIGYLAGASGNLRSRNIAIGSRPMYTGMGSGLPADDNIAVGTDTMIISTVSGGSVTENISIGKTNMTNIGRFTSQSVTNNIAIGTNSLANYSSSVSNAIDNNIIVGNRCIGDTQGLLNNNIVLGTNCASTGGSYTYDILIGTNIFSGGKSSNTLSLDNNVFIGSDISTINCNDCQYNIAIGTSPMKKISSGCQDNIVMGRDVFSGSGATGSNNIIIGRASMDLAGINTSNNIAIGPFSCRTLATGNVINIGASGVCNATGINQIMLGLGCNSAGSNNINIGTLSNAAGYSNIIIGHSASGITGTTRIGYMSSNATSQTKCFIDGIRGKTTDVVDAIAVLIDSNGQLGTVSSSIRYKENIELLENKTNILYDLNPVSFNYKNDSTKKTQYGLIAEEVNDIFPDIVVRNSEGEIETVQYHVLIPLMLNMIIKLEKRVKELER